MQESWSAIKESVCKRFLEQLCARIEQKIRESDSLTDFSGDLHVDCKYGGESRYSSTLWLYRESWAKYSGKAHVRSMGRTSVALNTQAVGPNGWIVGVLSPISADGMEDSDRERRERLERKLKNTLDDLDKTQPFWPRWDWVREDKRNLNSLIPDLHDEYEKDGEITRYFVDTFVEIAEKAIPIINEIEGSQM